MISKDEIKMVAIYLRVSRDEEGVGLEKVLKNQRKTLKDFCLFKGWNFEIYEEVASSVDENRSQLNLMMEKVKQKRYDAILVKAVDRLAREAVTFAKIQKQLAELNVFLATPSQTFDWNNPGDNLSFDMLNLFAKHEYRTIRERLMSGKLGRAKEGLWVHGIPPLGYDKDHESGKLVPNDKVEIVHFIFNSIIEGKTVTDVYKMLNARGIKTRADKDFSFNSILRIVNNEAYIGRIVTRKRAGKHGRPVPKKDWVIGEGYHKAIIDKDVWDKANKIVNTYSFKAPKAKNRVYPTTKLIRCGNCGRSQGSQKASSNGKLYLKTCQGPGCRNRSYAYEPILRSIREQVLNHTSEIAEQIEEFEQRDTGAEIEAQKTQINKEIAKTEKQLKNLTKFLIDETLTPTEYAEQKPEYVEKLEKLYEQLEIIEQQDPTDKIRELEEIKQRVEYLQEKWQFLDGEGLTDVEVNFALSAIIEKVEWTYQHGEDVVPELKITYK